VLLRLAASAAAAPLPHDEPAGHHRARALSVSSTPRRVLADTWSRE
jgi:hypothetical protein